MIRKPSYSLNRIYDPFEINKLLHDDPNRNNCQTTSPPQLEVLGRHIHEFLRLSGETLRAMVLDKMRRTCE